MVAAPALASSAAVRCVALDGLNSMAPTTARRATVVVRASGAEPHASLAVPRRAAAALLASAVLAAAPRPAAAFLGLGGASKDEVYAQETTAVVAAVRAAVTQDRDDPNKEATVAEVRKATNNWVAKYRRDASFSGKPSYGTTYSALNAVAGHFNSFGADAPLPKKRLERVIKELDDADKLLARGR